MQMYMQFKFVKHSIQKLRNKGKESDFNEAEDLKKDIQNNTDPNKPKDGHELERVEDKLDSSREVQEISIEAKDIKTNAAGDLKSDLKDQLDADSKYLTNDIEIKLTEESDVLIDRGIKDTEKIIDDTVPEISKDIEKTTEEAEALGEDVVKTAAAM